MSTRDLFMKALQEMLEEGVFEQIITCEEYDKDDIARAKHDRDIVEKWYKAFDGNLMKASFIGILGELHSAAVFQNIIVLMVSLGKRGDGRE